MDISLTICSCPHGTMIFLGQLWVVTQPISNPRVSYERYGYHLSIDNLCFIVGWVVWLQRIVKVEYFLTFFRKSEFFTLRWKQIFENCFQTALIWRRFDENLWNQLETVTNIPNFHMQKEALKNIEPLVSYLSLKCWPHVGSTQMKWYVHIL